MADEIKNKFKFKLLTGTDPQAQYDAIETKDALTFYLLGNGIGYLGETPLFGGGAQKTVVMTSGTLTEPEAGKLYVLDGVTYGAETLTGLYFYDGTTLSSYSDDLIATYIESILVKDQEMLAEGYTGDDKTVPTTKAVMSLVGEVLQDSNLVNAAFFRKVESHTLTAEDLTNSAIQLPTGAKEGDVGLLFTADNDDEKGNEQYYFVSLVSYLTSSYTVKDTKTVKLTMQTSEDGLSNEITADVKIAETEKSILVDEENEAGGIYLNKTVYSKDEATGTEISGINEDAPSSDKLVTEASLISYVQNSVLVAVDEAILEALADVVTYSVDDGTTSS